jgi:pimeloyl-ACP methyl ester carboxylesterase
MPNLVGYEPVIHYQRAGAGETVVLIHGLGANLAFWFMSVGRVLARDYHVICYDLRGHGASAMPDHDYLLPHMVQDLGAVLDQAGVEKAHVVGHSFGARVALAQAVLEPHRQASLTIADTQAKCLQPPMRLREWPYWQRWRAELQQMGHVGLPDDDEIITFELLKHFNDLSAGFAHGSLALPAPDGDGDGDGGGDADGRGDRDAGGVAARTGAAGAGAGGAAGALRKKRAVRRAAAAAAGAANAPSLRRRDMGRKGAARWTQLMEHTTAKAEFADERPLTREAIATIRVPTLAMFGEYSHCLPSCRQLEKLIPRTHVAIVPGAGHFHPAVKPRRFIKLLHHFLREHPGASEARALPPGGGRARAAAAAARAMPPGGRTRLR